MCTVLLSQGVYPIVVKNTIIIIIIIIIIVHIVKSQEST
jgi:hypothetical protein